MKTLNCKQVKKILSENKYVLFRDLYNNLYGVNCNILKTKKIKLSLSDDSRYTDFYSYIPCDFSTYISEKIPFIKSYSTSYLMDALI